MDATLLNTALRASTSASSGSPTVLSMNKPSASCDWTKQSEILRTCGLAPVKWTPRPFAGTMSMPRQAARANVGSGAAP